MEVAKPLPSGEGVIAAILDDGREEVFLTCTPTARGEMSCASGAVTELPERVFPSAWLLSSVMVRAVGSG
jgi:hypothetical protein